MNALDYVRDNRLRLWFLDYRNELALQKGESMNLTKFQKLMCDCLFSIYEALRPGKKCIFVTGELSNSRSAINTAAVVINASREVGGFELDSVIEDIVPKDRRIRRSDCRVKREWIVVLRKEI